MYTCSCMCANAHFYSNVCISFPFLESERKYKKLGKYMYIKIRFHSAVVV